MSELLALPGEVGDESNPYAPVTLESKQAWHAFTHYRDLGPTRSIRAAVEEHRSGCGKGKTVARGSESQWEAYSAKFRWAQRTLTWERDLDRARQDATRAEAIAMGERHAKIAEEMLEALYVPALVLVNKLRGDPEMLTRMMEKLDEPDQIVKFIAAVKDVATAVPALAKMEAVARGVRDDSEPEQTTVRVVVELDPDFTS